jgi:protocatechuate 3,4-dioxygenase alpha subunit
VKPGIHAEGHAPHIAVLIFARGINIHLHTRIYFPEDRKLIAADPDFARLSPEARDTLIASPGEGGGYRFDVHLQGPQETVFFDI